jgi:hypothetical protein
MAWILVPRLSRGDTSRWMLPTRVFAYGVFAGGYDELQDLNYRLMPGGGLGFHAIATEKTTLDLLGGPGYTRESYSTGLTRNLITLTLGRRVLV